MELTGPALAGWTYLSGINTLDTYEPCTAIINNDQSVAPLLLKNINRRSPLS